MEGRVEGLAADIVVVDVVEGLAADIVVVDTANQCGG
jgi:hypothetical protein